MPETIDYGAHAAAPPPIDYGSHEPTEKAIGDQPASVSGVAKTMTDQAGRFLGAAWQNVNPATLAKAALHPLDTAKSMFGATVDALDRTQAALKKGDHKEALTSLTGALPVLGPAGEQIVREIQEGKHAEALGHAAGLRLAIEAPKALPGAARGVKAVATKAAEAIKTPGTAQILGGAGEAAAGAGAMATTSPIGMVYGAAGIAKGIDRVSRGMELRRAAKAPKASEPIRPATRTAPADVDPMTPQIDTSTELTPEMEARIASRQSPASTPPPNLSLPVRPAPPGYTGQGALAPEAAPVQQSAVQTLPQAATIAPSAHLLDEITVGLGGKSYAKLDPRGKATVDRIAADMTKQVTNPVTPTAPVPAQTVGNTAPESNTAGNIPADNPVPLSAQPTAKVIPFKNPEIPAEVYEGQARAVKVKDWADLFEKHDMGPEDVRELAQAAPDSATGKLAKQLAETAGLNLPSATTTAAIIKELKSRQVKMSPAVESKLKAKSAMSTATELRDLLDTASQQ